MTSDTFKEKDNPQEAKAHTPTPWFWDSYSGIHAGKGDDSEAVAWVDHLLPEDRKLHGDDIYGPRAKEARANAVFIVRACNSHEELLEALEALRATHPDEPSADVAACRKADEAIKKARGE